MAYSLIFSMLCHCLRDRSGRFMTASGGKAAMFGLSLATATLDGGLVLLVSIVATAGV